jgi:radical SAM superfamily enzyme YgiQ (UPF0313 family)
VKRVLLADLPTFPRGLVSLSLPVVAACLRPRFECRLLDLNFTARDEWASLLAGSAPLDMIGFKVSAQGLPAAREATAAARRAVPGARIVWGGELPTLLPEACLAHADAVVRGRFEPVAREFADDLDRGDLRRIYEAPMGATFETPVPALDLISFPGRYLSFMGAPLETSHGCVHGCTFCMVHSVQPQVLLTPAGRVERDLAAHPREFVHVVDYNLANDREHLIAVAAALGRSPATGWMAELCLENLDDARTLEALSRSRCRAVYCGLESVSTAALKTVAKRQNRTADYLRVIRLAQQAGVEVASGYIVGLEGSDPAAFADFCDEAGILYLKLTTLTFNPGTKVRAAMAAQGTFLSEAPEVHDGVRVSFLPRGATREGLLEEARALIKHFYSPASLWRRSRHIANPARRAEFVLFSRLYGEVYREWLKADLLDPDGGALDDLLSRPWAKGAGTAACETALGLLRRATA